MSFVRISENSLIRAKVSGLDCRLSIFYLFIRIVYESVARYYRIKQMGADVMLVAMQLKKFSVPTTKIKE